MSAERFGGGDRPDDVEQWRQATRVFEALAELDEGERRSRLAALPDPGLAARVERLLAADRVPESVLGAPLALAAGWLAEDRAAAGLDADPIGECIGPWRVLERLGSGGMGVVFVAERADGAFERRVALKLLKRGLDSVEIVERFLRERRILARLRHPNIAQLLDGGLAPDGRPYFALELVAGEPITDWCAARRLPLEERLRLFLDVVAAVDFAHRNLVVHRDLKPSNVLVTAGGEVQLLDFGIAKLIDDEDGATGSGARPHTPLYAAPEQLAGEPVTTATDVYALGLLLWELTTGEPARLEHGAAGPAAAAATPSTPPSVRVLSAPELAHAPVRDGSPRARRRLARRLAGDLDKVTLMALRREPERRYASAAALGDDLRRFLGQRPVAARGDGFAYRALKLVRRRRGAVTAGVLVALVALGGGVATWRAARVAEAERERAERRFEEMRRLARAVLLDAAGSPGRLSGEPAARQRLIEEALLCLDDPALPAGSQASKLAELAAAYERLVATNGSSP